MAELHIITAINKTYSYLLGDWETAEQHAEPANGLKAVIQAWADIEAKKKTIRQALDHLEAVALMYKPSWDPGEIDPTVRRPDKRKKGEVSRVALTILRKEGKPLTLRELTNLTAQALAIEVIDERQRTRIAGSLNGVLQRRLGRLVYKHEGVPARYAFYPMGQEPLAVAASTRSSSLSEARSRRRRAA